MPVSNDVILSNEFIFKERETEGERESKEKKAKFD